VPNVVVTNGTASVKGNAACRRVLQPKKLRELKLHVASFNISISTQLNKLVGSERDFVHECQVLKRDCFENGVNAFSKLDKLDVLALQEVELPEAESMFQRSQPTLNRTMRGSVEDPGWDTSAHCSILWDSNVLGESIWSRTFATESGRPCLQVVVEKDGWRLLLMTLSAPHMSSTAQYDSFTTVLSKNVPDISVHDVILMGDFNDHGVFISSDAPLSFGPFEVSQGLNQAQIRAELITCCWHKEDQELNPRNYPSMTEAGDYILAENVTEQRIPTEFAENKDVPFASDHLPVEATVVLRSG
tara:strand:+ start:11325 stop:12230 length:906 start_codon:yes stop_codon:yes gene_type:complete